MLVAAACAARGRLGRLRNAEATYRSRYCAQYPHCVHKHRGGGGRTGERTGGQAKRRKAARGRRA
ncbi:MAG: hypothetical protein OXK17_00775 [Thaumarchaeota archaeon]|nr:hypothetical protein [Nitrososphaerota archaeon]